MRHDAHAAVIVLYLLIALGFTFPLALHLLDAVPGTGIWNDEFAFMWNLQWAKTSLLGLHTSPFFTDYLLYPHGEYFYLGTLSILNGLISIPLQLALGVVGAYNLLVIFYLVLGAYGAFLLGRHFVKDGIAAFLSGLIFGFSPYFVHVLHGHLNLLAAAWLPLFALFFAKSFEEKGAKNPAIAGLLLAVIGFTDWQVFMYALMLAAAFAAARLWLFRGKHSGSALLRAGAGIALGCMLVSPLAVAAFAEAVSGEHELPSAGERLFFSLDLADLVSPPQFGTLLRAVDVLKGTTPPSLWTENAGYLGIVALTASLIAFFNVRKREVKAWALVAALFAVLSLGPVLHVFWFNTGIPLPTALLQMMPAASLTRVSSRFIIVAVLALSVLAAYGFLFFAKAARGKKGLFAGVAALMILIELIPAPIALNRTDAVPAFYYTLAKEQGDFAVLEVPPMASDAAGGRYIQVYSYYQTIHGKRRVDGGSNVPSAHMYWFLANTAFISQFCSPMLPDVLSQGAGFESDLLAHYNIRYIVLHRSFLDAEESAFYGKLLRDSLGPPVYDDGDVAAYRAGAPSGRPFATLADGWSPRRAGGWGTVRETDGNATITLVSPSPHTFRLRFEGWVEKPQVIRIMADGREIKSVNADGWFDFGAEAGSQGGETGLEIDSGGKAFFTRVDAR